MRQACKGLLCAFSLAVWIGHSALAHADVIGPADSELARLFQEGKYAAALPVAETLLASASSTSDYASGVALNTLAEVLYNLGRYEEARPMYERSLNLIEMTKGVDHPDAAVVLNNLGGMQRELGEFDHALPLIQRALGIAETKQGLLHPATATSLNNLGLLYKQMGQSEKALDLLGRALSIREATFGVDAFETGRSINNLASIYVQLKRYEEALPLYERALAITVKTSGPNHVAVAIRLNNVASVYFHLGNYDKALSLFEQAVEITETSLGPLHISNATNINNLAGVYEATNQFQKANALYEKALLVSFAAGVPESSFNIAANLARFHDGQGNSRAAIFFAKQAINIFQGIRFNSLNMDRSVRKSLIEKNQQIYHELANWLIDLNRMTEARQVLKMLKEEEYFDFIGRDATGDTRKTNIGFSTVEQPLALEIVALSQEAVLLGKAQTAIEAGESSDSTIAKEVRDEQTRASLSVLDVRLQRQSERMVTTVELEAQSELVSRGSEQDALVTKVRADVASIVKGVALVEYLVVGDRIRILLTTEKSTHVRTVDIDGKDFQRMLVEFRQSLENQFADPRPVSAKLYAVLVAPIISELQLAHVKTLMLSLEGGLRYVPFSALFDGQHYLVEQYALTMYTAAAQSQAIVHSDRNWEIVAFGTTQAKRGFSALPGVRQELAAIVGQGGLSGEVNLDEQFTAAQVRTSLSKGAPVLHLASHFRFTPGTEVDSFLLLGDGNALTLRELRGDDYHFQKLDLLTLSACETAMQGGGVIQMAAR